MDQQPVTKVLRDIGNGETEVMHDCVELGCDVSYDGVEFDKDSDGRPAPPADGRTVTRTMHESPTS